MKVSLRTCNEACENSSWYHEVVDNGEVTNLPCNKATVGKVDLGGIYSFKPLPKPPPPDESEDSIITPLDCEPFSINIKHWDETVRALSPYGITNDSMVDFARHYELTGNSRRSASERIVEKFGGLALGFSGPAEEFSKAHPIGYKQNFSACTAKVDSHVDELCKLQTSVSRTSRPVAPSQQAFGKFETETSKPESYKSKGSFVFPQINEMEPPRQVEVLHKRGGKTDRTDGFYCRMPESKDTKIMKYVKKYNLDLLFEYFLALLCINTPPDPYRFLSKVASEMIESRACTKDMETAFERVFHVTHIKALYRLFDKERNGFLSYMQYKNGMETLGLTRYNRAPKGSDMNKITEETFVSEGIQAVDYVLRSFLKIRKLKRQPSLIKQKRISPITEENGMEA